MSESTKPPPRQFDLNPPKYATPLPSIPRAPRVPSDFGQLMSPTVAARDTDRVEPASGDHEVSDDPEKTPIEAPWTLRQFAAKIDEAIEASKQSRTAAIEAADNSLRMMSRLDEFARELKVLAQRVTSLEVSRQWAPLLIASLAIAVTIWLAFKVHDLELQVLDLQHQVMTLEQR